MSLGTPPGCSARERVNGAITTRCFKGNDPSCTGVNSFKFFLVFIDPLEALYFGQEFGLRCSDSTSNLEFSFGGSLRCCGAGKCFGQAAFSFNRRALGIPENWRAIFSYELDGAKQC